MKSNTPLKQLTATARAGLSGCWGKAMGVSFAYILLYAGLGRFSYAGWILQLVFAAPLATGMHMYFLATVRRQPNPFVLLFKGFDQFSLAVCAFMLTLIIVLAWIAGASMISGLMLFGLYSSGMAMGTPIMLSAALTLLTLLLVGLFYLQMRFYLVLYLVADGACDGAGNALSRSAVLMRGNYLRLILLWCRFIGWYLLSLLTLGIGFLWFIPYLSAAIAAFYSDLAKSPRTEWIPLAAPVADGECHAAI